MDWLKTVSPMYCDWQHKSLQFPHQGQIITIQTVPSPTSAVQAISAKQVCKSLQANDIWACAVIRPVSDPPVGAVPPSTKNQEALQDLLVQYADIFQDPKQLPPQRVYDHAIPLYPDAIPINARPYHYSPHHKSELSPRCSSC